LPVRSAVLKQCTGGLVVRWVTTSESPLLYVFAVPFASLRTLSLQPFHAATYHYASLILPLPAASEDKACVNRYAPS
ncbi:hypothetical protein EJ02DRAFT_355461, partial [Clathrospora elynae]